MTIEIVPICRYKVVLRDCFSDDEHLLNKYHIEAGNGLDACVERTYRDMKKFSNFVFYVIKEAEEIVAYFGKELVGGLYFMTGFHIKTKYRTKEFISYFWEVVKDKIGAKHVFSSIYKKNDRAANFLAKKGQLYADMNGILTYKIF